jgi:hypothetical protein
MREILMDKDLAILRNPYAAANLLAGVFMETNGDGLTTIKNTGSTFQNTSISDNGNASFTHDLIFDGTVSVKINGNGGQAISLQSDVLTAAHLTVVESLITGNMDSVNGYNINEYQLIYKLILWGYITATYVKTIKPYVVYNFVTNSNDATTALSYVMPVTKITANKAAITISSDPLAIIWSDGVVVDCGGVDAGRTGAGVGFVYLIGDYTKLVAINQSISSIDRFSNNLIELDLSGNSGLNIQNSYFDNIANLEVLDLGNCTNSKVDSILTKYNLTYLNLGFTDSIVTNVDNHTNLTYLSLFFTDSTITKVEHNILLTYLNLSGSLCLITDITQNELLIDILLYNTDSLITDITKNTLLGFIHFSGTKSIITDVSKNTLLINITLSNTQSNITDVSQNTILTQLNIPNTQSNITDVSQNTSLYRLHLLNTNSKITDVNDLCRDIYLSNTNNTAADNNTLMQNLIDTPRTGIRQLTITANAAINQANVNILVGRGWDITQS